LPYFVMRVPHVVQYRTGRGCCLSFHAQLQSPITWPCSPQYAQYTGLRGRRAGVGSNLRVVQGLQLRGL